MSQATLLPAPLTQRAVKPRPSGRGYKAHLDWNFCLSAFCVLTGDTAAGHAVSACGEIVRPGGIGGWFVPVKFPTWECLRRKPSLVPLGSLGEAGTRSGTQSQDCLRWESPDFRRGRMSTRPSLSTPAARPPRPATLQKFLASGTITLFVPFKISSLTHRNHLAHSILRRLNTPTNKASRAPCSSSTATASCCW